MKEAFLYISKKSQVGSSVWHNVWYNLRYLQTKQQLLNEVV